MTFAQDWFDMLYSQPLSTRFGTNLIDLLLAGKWTSLDIAVAWVRASGTVHLEPALETFLKAGHPVRIIVGVDLENTSKEGLESLLELQKHGPLSVFVHHNEASTIFHPKLYLFQNSRHAKLIVASNNITEAGLFRNTEAGLELEFAVNDPTIISTKNALSAWCDTSLGIAKKLDSAFLVQLVNNGYVPDEASIKVAMAARRSSGKTGGKSKIKLFGSVSVTAPKRPISPLPSPPKTVSITKKKPSSAKATPGIVPVAPTTQPGQVLLMRVRTARRSATTAQAQLPISEPFFYGVTQILSVSANSQRVVSPTFAKRNPSRPNTLKLEMPETVGMVEPVARFEQTPLGMQFEVYDATSPQGQLIMQVLKAGIVTNPPATKMKSPGLPPTNQTWWRVI